MIDLIPWTQREFVFDQPVGTFPAVVERLRGTPARAAELVVGLPEEVLGNRVNEKWSVKEHLGHLVDLEALDEKRLREFQNRVAVLSPADIGNQTTEHANHRATPIAELLGRLRAGRIALVQKLEELTDDEVAVIAVHPRLKKQMRIVDWDLAWVTRSIREMSEV